MSSEEPSNDFHIVVETESQQFAYISCVEGLDSYPEGIATVLHVLD